MAGLTNRQLNQFDEDGYLIVEDVISPSQLAEIEAEYNTILDDVTPDLVSRGIMKEPHGTSFSERYCEALEQLDDMYELYQHLDISLPMLDSLDHDTAMNAGPAVFHLLTNERLLDIAESLVGPEIYSNPVQHTRIKPPRNRLPAAVTDANIAATLWHQDAAVINTDADETNMLTVWLAITDATIENGCLIATSDSHEQDRTLHCPGKVFPAEIYIPESIVDQDRVTPLEVKAGGMVLLHKLTEHGSLENMTDDIRWSFDLRYQPIGQPTGRSVFPGFVARSMQHPELVVKDPDDWAQLWWDARDRIASGQDEMVFNNRWDVNAGQAVCA